MDRTALDYRLELFNKTQVAPPGLIEKIARFPYSVRRRIYLYEERVHSAVVCETRKCIGVRLVNLHSKIQNISENVYRKKKSVE